MSREERVARNERRPQSGRESAGGQIPSSLMRLQGQVSIFVIPAKAGIQMVEAKFAIRNQA